MWPSLQAPPRNRAFQYIWHIKRQVEASKHESLQGNNHKIHRAGLECIVCLYAATCYRLSHTFSRFLSHLGVIRIKEQPFTLSGIIPLKWDNASTSSSARQEKTLALKMIKCVQNLIQGMSTQDMKTYRGGLGKDTSCITKVFDTLQLTNLK